MTRCEDYPACGHTDGLACDWEMTKAEVKEVWAHAGCDHEAGDCYLNDIEPTCDVCGGSSEDVDWHESCGCCAEHCQQFVDCPEVEVHA